jgi:hypothetical protein
MHKTKLTLALATLGIAGFAASDMAAAQIATVTGGNSDLLFAAVDTKTGETYYDNLGVLALPTSGLTSGVTTFTDASFTQFVADAGSDQINYAVFGGGFGKGAANPIALNSLSLTAGGSTAPSSLANFNLSNLTLIDENIINPVNNASVIPGSGTTNTGNGYLVTSGTAEYSDASGNTSVNGNISGVTDVAAGTANAFYNFTQNKANGSSGSSSETLLGSFLFSGNTLTYTAAGGTAPVPLPAAVWLLVSGVSGLIGIGRRRKTAA